ncbi:hypothetical protein [Nocardioides cavernaquae]|uniref:Uncharacterized protein n=1 Tax=Nocardioides cavernaquae TaxID=2321396 RepID=A0A3A5H9B3_9ACTN|nr:hypothetical protein [Nocardioides cavernaquae]RJS45965.1 hypothetical protein D4739_06810 [Nocardioides cavernaquae]
MEAATATASCGQVRSRRRARTWSRGCWRLVVLLGLSWVAIILLGGAAQAAPCEKQACAAAPSASPTTPDAQPLPLVGEILANVGDTAAALPVQQVTDIATKTLNGLTGKAPEATQVAANLPVVSSIDAVGTLAETVRDTADSAGGEKLLDVKLPSAGSTAAPLVAGLAHQVVSTAGAVLGAAEVLAVPLPLAGGLTDTLRTVTGTLELTTQVVVGTTYAVAGTADQAVDLAGSALSPILETITSPAGTIAVTGPSAGAASAQLPATDAFGSSPVAGEATAAQLASTQASQSLEGRVLSGPAVPPPDSNDSTTVAVPPASDIVTVLPVPVSGAGFTSGNGGTTPAPRLDQTLVRVESGPTVEFEVAKPIEGPAGPMPGTPAADPAFSPD